MPVGCLQRSTLLSIATTCCMVLVDSVAQYRSWQLQTPIHGTHFQAFLVGTPEHFFSYTDLHKFSFGFRLEGLQEMVQECTTALLISFLLRCTYIIWISVSNIFWQGQDLAQTCKDLFFYFLAICSELELANFQGRALISAQMLKSWTCWTD
jgi:hypothetical protein